MMTHEQRAMTNEERILKLLKLWYLIWTNRSPNVNMRELDDQGGKLFQIFHPDFEVLSRADGSWLAQFEDIEGNRSLLQGTYEFIYRNLEAVPVHERPEYKG